jgi:hypothetical protein
MSPPGEAHFRVSGLLKLQSRPGTFVCGEIVDGEVKRGMEILWPIHGDALTMPVAVRDVECIDYAPGASGIALGVGFDRNEIENEQLLRDLFEVGMIVTIRTPSVSDSAAAG